MNILITGASGHLGSYITKSLVDAGINVTAIIRRENSNILTQNKLLNIITADLLEKGSLNDALKGIDVVIHCAAAMKGDYRYQYDNTVLATENLIREMEQAGVKRLVLVGSYSVYDYAKIAKDSTLTEGSCIKNIGATLGAYAKTKLMQEECIRHSNLNYTILRFGIIVADPLPWVSQIGVKVGRRTVLFGKNGEVPSINLFNCPSAFIAAINQPKTIGKTYNLVDDDLMGRGQYAALLTQKKHNDFSLFNLPYHLVLFFVLIAQPFIFTLRLLKLKVPQIMNLESFYERSKPLKHSNELFKKDTSWTPLTKTQDL